MKRFLTMNEIRLAVILVLAAWFGLPAPAAHGAEINENISNYLQLLQSDFNSAKVEIVNQIMKLSAEDAKKFSLVHKIAHFTPQAGSQIFNI
jgi:hypothetical protein